MTTKTDIQTRGHCQCCGRQQAVKAAGRMSQHGYTVENGWFSGVCQGHRHKPLEHDRAVADSICVSVRAQAAGLRADAAAMRAGKLHPATCQGAYDCAKRAYAAVPWDQCDDYMRSRGLRDAILQAENRASLGESFAAALTQLADKCFGQPLIIVTKPEPPAPIVRGEKRLGFKDRVLQCRYVEKGRVYFEDEKGFRGWMGTQSWRPLPAVEAKPAA